MTVDLKHFIELDISTTLDSGFYITDEKQSGEYKDALVLNTSIRHDTLFITDPINPLFSFPQDKLSAHKITDSKAVLVLPSNIDLFLNLAEANLHLQGTYKNVRLNIHSGQVSGKNLKGNMEVVSVNADVLTTDLENYSITGTSRNGTVEIKSFNKNNRYYLKVETINGDLHLN